MDWFVYIAKTKKGHYYTGISNNVVARIDKHNSGKGSKFFRISGDFVLAYVSNALTKSEALKREIKIKGWARLKKERLINGESYELLVDEE